MGRLFYYHTLLLQFIQAGFSFFDKLYFSRFYFNFNQFLVFLKPFKIDEEFPSCFQNMTRLTYFYLSNVRRSDPEPIPFPTQFCNMIYLQKFTSRHNKFSGLERIVGALYFLSFFSIGPIPIDLTRLVGLKSFNISGEPLLEGYFE